MLLAGGGSGGGPRAARPCPHAGDGARRWGGLSPRRPRGRRRRGRRAAPTPGRRGRSPCPAAAPRHQPTPAPPRRTAPGPSAARRGPPARRHDTHLRGLGGPSAPSPAGRERKMAAGLAAGRGGAGGLDLGLGPLLPALRLRLPPALTTDCPAARRGAPGPSPRQGGVPAPRPEWKAEGGGAGPARRGVARAAGAGGTDGGGGRRAGVGSALLAAGRAPARRDRQRRRRLAAPPPSAPQG